MRYAALFLCLSACTGRTEIVVGVVTDLKARGQIDDVKFQALRNAVPVVSHDWSLADIPANQYELPGSFGIYSPDGSAVRVEMTVTGLQNGQPIVERTSILSLIPGATLFLRMGLVGDCGTVDGPTCSDDESCIEGVCRPKEMDPHRLPAYRKELVDHVDCQSGTRYIISSTGELMPSDGVDCAADEYCQEGLCLKRLPSDPTPSSSQPEWIDTSNPSPAPLRAISGDPVTGDVWAVGEGGAVMHGTGGATDPGWGPVDPGTTSSLFGVIAIGGEVIAVGSGGVVVHKKGGQWTLEPLPLPVDRLDGIWGATLDDLWAVGRASGNLPAVFRRTGAVWSSVAVDGPSGLRAVWGAAVDDVWAAGPSSHVQHWDGKKWSRISVEDGHDFLGVGGAGGATFLIGRKGLIARAQLSGIQIESAPVKSDLFAIWGGESLYVAGDYGKILHSAGDGTWTEQVSGTEAALFAVSGLKGQIFAAGRLGKILRADGNTPTAPCYVDADCPAQCTGAQLVLRSCNGKCVATSNAACGGGFVCASDGMSCLTACAADADCQSGFYCGGDGQCKAQLAQGTSCDDAGCKSAGCRQCAGGLFCTDHVCCDKSPSQCNGCMQCSAPTGTCNPVLAGSDPHGTCAGMTAECTQTSCNGNGSCANTGNSCGTNVCAMGKLTTHVCSDGTCTAEAPVTCANSSPCLNNTQCAGKCSDDTGCPAGDFCNATGDCVPSHNPGAPCDIAKECKSGTCHLCVGTNVCAFGVCCENACASQCQMCNSSGKCVTNNISTQPVQGRSACQSGEANCGASCDGVNDTCQFALTSVVCAGPGCANDHTSSISYCTGTGKCNNPQTTTCGSFAQYACVGAGSCNQRCNVDTDCASTPVQDTCNLLQHYCGYPNGHSCRVATDCGSGYCSAADAVCCNEVCKTGTSGDSCTKLDARTGEYHAAGRLNGCKTGTCSFSITFDCNAGYLCIPSVGSCSSSCQCDNANDTHTICFSSSCDSAAGFNCARTDHVCLKQPIQ
jgi:hypothetical protein